MKISRLWFSLLLIITLLSTLATPALAATASSKASYTVTLVSTELVSNDHVGNEWATAFTANGKTIEEGESIKLSLSSTGSIKLQAEATELDKIPDEGSATKTIKVSSIKKELTSSIKVTVTENRGRYSGNQAVWKFTYKIAKTK
ncbi:hypothetical protein [Paenibacillus radicis (ex Gao et al. 2016)]|uniref:WxL domain-containing protein n=1 Tax=Paenibacillus radicis (ex Gao et al. 2016) TaxID=1737354 RepID=A0A917HR40_9BACL|nr:hypothetical protein [Paenibacillus radicis (ex Gao et al. 2016)]GGG86821.1 hypothetical protein GCM10010918_51290 [Paenibacillus radicis (ex Gao et al. 2016)]